MPNTSLSSLPSLSNKPDGALSSLGALPKLGSLGSSAPKLGALSLDKGGPLVAMRYGALSKPSVLGGSSGSSSNSNSNCSSSSHSGRIQPLSLAVMFSPPVLALVYADSKHGGKKRVKQIRLTSYLSSTDYDAKLVSEDLLADHPAYLSKGS